jgi:hypothetical protein
MLDTMYLAILIGAGLVMAAVFTTWIAFRIGAPLLLIFLAVGLAAGKTGSGWNSTIPASPIFSEVWRSRSFSSIPDLAHGLRLPAGGDACPSH